MQTFERKNIRLPADRYRGKGLYFVTLCFHQRRLYGANPRVALWLIDQVKAQAAHSKFFVHAYCVMPDHMHLLVASATDTGDLTEFVALFKQRTAYEFEGRTRRRLWQFKYYDHVVRSRDSPDGVAWYIWLNPVRKGLCQTPSEYSFLGSFTAVGRAMLKQATRPEWLPPWNSEDVSGTKRSAGL